MEYFGINFISDKIAGYCGDILGSTSPKPHSDGIPRWKPTEREFARGKKVLYMTQIKQNKQTKLVKLTRINIKK